MFIIHNKDIVQFTHIYKKTFTHFYISESCLRKTSDDQYGRGVSGTCSAGRYGPLPWKSFIYTYTSVCLCNRTDTSAFQSITLTLRIFEILRTKTVKTPCPRCKKKDMVEPPPPKSPYIINVKCQYFICQYKLYGVPFLLIISYILLPFLFGTNYKMLFFLTEILKSVKIIWWLQSYQEP